MSAPMDHTGGPRASWQRIVVDGFEAGGYVARHRGADRVYVHCPNPGHGAGNGDRKASVTVDYDAARECTDVKCHGGCPTVDVLAPIGRALADLYDYPRAARDDRRLRPVRSRACGHDGPEPTRRYVYPDRLGEVVLTEFRKECGTCGKRIASWVNPKDVPAERRVIYRLPQTLEAIARGETIYIPEGPKSAELLAERGHAATCNPFGADDGSGSKWLPQMTEQLAGARKAIVPADHDVPGYKHAKYIAEQLRAAGIPVQVVRSATGRPKDDVAEHFQAGHGIEDLVEVDPEVMLAELEGGAGPADKRGMTSAAPEIEVLGRKLGQRIPIDPRDLPSEMSLEQGRRLDPGPWPEIIPKILPVGAAIIYTRPGAGKTTFSTQCEMNVAWRLPLAGYQPEDPGRCLVIDLESGMHMAILRSIQLAPFGSVNADRGEPGDMIHVHTTWPGSTFAERFAELEKVLRDADHEGRAYKLIRIDTMRAFFGATPQGMNAYDWDAGCVIRVNDLAEQLGCCILLIHHANKAGEISGSTALSGKCNVTYKLERRPRESEGLLRCDKNRVARELSWPLIFDLATGSWSFTDRIIAGQAATTATRRAIIDYLVQHGPAAGPQIRAALPGVKEDTAKKAMTRLANDGWIIRGEDEIWSLTEEASITAGPLAAPGVPEPPESEPEELESGRFGWAAGSAGETAQEGLGECAVCHGPMDILEPGQLTHPNCDPEGTITASLAAAPAAQPELDEDGEDRADDVGAGPITEEQIRQAMTDLKTQPGEDQADDVGEACGVCGELLSNADRHPDCEREETSSARWPAMNVMREAFGKHSRMKPIPWIPPPGHPKAEGKPTRDLPPWQAAERADIGAFRWARPGVLEEYGPDRLVLPLDRNGSYPSACSSVPVAPNILKHAGPLEQNPRDLGPPEQYGQRAGKPTGLAGICCLVVPEWPHPELPHPLGRNAVPGELLVVASGAVEDLWRLHEEGLIAAPQVADSFMGRRNTSLFEPFYQAVKAARAQHAGDPAMFVAVKRSSSIAIRKLYPKAAPSPWWRPDWYAAIVSQAMFRHWRWAQRAVAAGAVLVSLGSVDEAAYLIPEDADPGTWVPEPYRLGTGFGEVKVKDTTVRAGHADLTGIDPGRITPAGREGFVNISGPVPLGVWMARHA